MAADKLDICNAALADLGEEELQAFDQPGAVASVVRRLYPLERDRLLSLQPWSFATERSVPEQIATAEEGIFYVWPPETLRVVALLMGNNPVTYRVEKPLRIRADSPADTLVVISRISEALWPAFFADALSAACAARFCLPITDSTSRTTALQTLAERKLATARLADSQQNSPLAVSDPGPLISVRG